MHLPRYPVYIPTKGRADACLTARALTRDGVPFHLVVEPPEVDAYAEEWDRELILELPFHDLGLGAVPARNWIKEHATSCGFDRHWQLDDNINGVRRRVLGGRRVRAPFGVALACVEDFTDRYANVALSGLNYTFFLKPRQNDPPFYQNCRIYSCSLVNNAIPYRWRGHYNDDTDMCLQVLSGGWTTILVNAFMVDKVRTMQMAGGMTAKYSGDGRLKMARSLERLWPGVVEVHRAFQRPQHIVKDYWRRFDTPLILREGVERPVGTDEYGMRLVQVRAIANPDLAALVAPRLLEDAGV
jgi:hypothetical protein